MFQTTGSADGDALVRDVVSWRERLAGVAGGDPEDVYGSTDAHLARTGATDVALLAELESLVAAAAAVQARASVRLDRVRREQERRQEVAPRKRGRGVAAEIGLARRISVSRATRALGLAHALGELPHTKTALAAGRLSEWRAALIARAATCLDEPERAALDAELCERPDTLAGKGDRAVGAAAEQAAYRRDPESVTRRAARAESERRVTLRPAPDTMTYLTALLPVTQGVAAYAALRSAADSARSEGRDERSCDQVMSDTLVERITGQARAEDVPLQVNLVMSDATLLGHGGDPAEVAGHGPVPPAWAREQVMRAPRPAGAGPAEPGGTTPASAPRRAADQAGRPPAADMRAQHPSPDAPRPTDEAPGSGPTDAPPGSGRPDAPPGSGRPDTTPGSGAPDDPHRSAAAPAPREHVTREPAAPADPGSPGESDPGRAAATMLWIRRLYAAPDTGALVALDSRSRTAPDGLADFVRLRDDHRCRVPWCDAPARHIDHVVAHRSGGATEASNLQSLCEAHNYAKEAPGWRAEVVDPLTAAELGANEAGRGDGTRRAASHRHEVTYRTPAGQLVRSVAPRVGGPVPDAAASGPRVPETRSRSTTPSQAESRPGTPSQAESRPGTARQATSRPDAVPQATSDPTGDEPLRSRSARTPPGRPGSSGTRRTGPRRGPLRDRRRDRPRDDPEAA